LLNLVTSGQKSIKLCSTRFFARNEGIWQRKARYQSLITIQIKKPVLLTEMQKM